MSGQNIKLGKKELIDLRACIHVLCLTSYSGHLELVDKTLLGWFLNCEHNHGLL